MRIALLTRRFDPHGGGTERDLIITAECLRAAGYEITIFAREVRGPSRDFKVREVEGIPLGERLHCCRSRMALPKLRVAKAAIWS